MLSNSISEKIKILGLTYPFTKGELKHNFRQLVLVHHPDKGGTEENFIRIKDAYDILLSMGLEDTEEKEVNIVRTMEGDLVSELGKGLSDTINGTKCRECLGSGHYILVRTIYSVKHRCINCNGMGFVNRKGGGISIFNILFGSIICPVCHGSGGIEDVTNVKMNHTCFKCKGTGEIEIDNPALPKNRVFNRFKNEDRRPKKQYCSCRALMRNGKCWRCD